MFIKIKGKSKIAYLPMTASTAVSNGALAAWSSGTLIPATSTTASYNIAGVFRKTIAATDSDYTVAGRLVPVEVPLEKNCLYEADVTSGLVAGDKGAYCDMTNSLTVNRAASTYDVVKCEKVISGTKGIFSLNIGTDAAVKA